MSPISNFFAFFKLIFAYCVFCSFTWILRRTAHFSFTILNPKFSHHFNSCRTWTHGKHSFSHMYTLHLLCISTSTPPPSSNQDSSSWKISAKSSNYQVTKNIIFFWARAIRKILKWLLLISNPILRNLSWKTYSEYLFCRSNNINDKIGFCQLNKKLGFFVRPINWAECRFLRLKTLNFRESLFLFSGVRKSRFLVQTLVFISQALHIACKPYWKFLL